MRTVWIVVGAALVVVCAGTVAGGYALLRGAGTDTGPARAAADAFLRDIQGGHYISAYGRLCDRTHTNYSEAQFTAYAQGQPKIRSYKITGVDLSTVNGDDSALVTVAITQDTGSTATHVMPLIRQSVWYVCGEPY